MNAQGTPLAQSNSLGQTPEDVAAIWQALDERLAMISDGEVRAQYRVLWRRRFEAEVSLGRDERPPVVRVGHDAAGQLVVLGPVAKTSGTEADEGGYVWPDDDRESAQRLAMLVARDMELGRQIKELQADRRDVRALAKAIGFDAKAFAAVIRDIEADTEKREEREASHALYRQVLGVQGPMTEAMLPRLDDARRADARRVSARRTARGMLIEARAAQLEGR